MNVLKTRITSSLIRSGLVTFFIIVVSMTISVAGLTNIIKYGYGYCGYLAIAVVVIPFLTVGVYKNYTYLKGREGDFTAEQDHSV